MFLLFIVIVTGYDLQASEGITDTVKPVLSELKMQVKTIQDSLTKTPVRYLEHANKTVSTREQDGIAYHDSATSKVLSDAKIVGVEDAPSFYVPQRKGCKSFVMTPIWIYDYTPVVLEHSPAEKQEKAKHTPFLQVHGNVLYNVNYYSNIDTPYNEQNVYQHTIQTYLDILVKGQYPVRVYLTNRFSNSSLFRNFSDFNFSYTNTQFNQMIREQVRRRFLASMPSPKSLDSLQHLLDTTILKLRGMELWIKNPALLQRMVEERERALKEKLMGKADTLITQAKPELDSLPLADEYARRKQQADSLRNRIATLQQSLKTAYLHSKSDINRISRAIEQADNPSRLKAVMEELHLEDTILPKGYKPLMAIRSFSLGRSVVNYSELSVKNISVNGVQSEYNPGSYYAVAAGKVDYRFRDFIVKSPGQSGQFLTVLRYGRGFKDGNNIILTYFNGRRQLYNANTTDTQQVKMPSTALMGITIEGNYRLTENITLTGEIAKSSMPGYAGDSTSKNNLPSQMVQFSNRTNEAYAIKVNAYFPATQTRIRGTYKHLGINYQSFSIFTDGTAQTTWNASVNQLFFHRQLDVTIGANTNDFSNPLIGSNYKSTTVFKSIQATLRKKYWPVVSLGYFPSSQVTKLGDGHYTENLFYTLVGNVTHTYRVKQLMMNSTIVYTQFYNRATDSGFVYFNTKNLLLSQAFFWQQFTLQANAAAAINQEYRLYTLEGKGVYTINKYISAGAGMKYNRQTNYNIQQYGYSVELTLNIPKLGQIQFSADKGFIPGPDKRLITNNTGRATYFKTF